MPIQVACAANFQMPIQVACSANFQIPIQVVYAASVSAATPDQLAEVTTTKEMVPRGWTVRLAPWVLRTAPGVAVQGFLGPAREQQREKHQGYHRKHHVLQ